MSVTAVRSLFLIKQGLTAFQPLGSEEKNIVATVAQTGLIQLDSVNVVARSHYLVPLARIGAYERTTLDALIASGRCLVEQWTHCASLITIKDFHSFLPIVMARASEPLSVRKQAMLGPQYQAEIEAVYRHIRDNGPLRARDFPNQAPAATIRSWWSKKPAAIALAWLSYLGRLIVSHRVQFEPVYDLPERVLPRAVLRQTTDLPTSYRWVVIRSLESLGAGTAKHIADYFRQPMKRIREAINSLVEDGTVVEIKVSCWREVAFVLKADVQRIDVPAEAPCKTVLLSPFDSLVWHRDRTAELFNFHFKNEMYTPLKLRERVHGYFVMPILHEDRLIARADVKVERSTGTLILRRIAFEAGEKPAQSLSSLVEPIANLMRFTGSQRFRVDESPSARFASQLTAQCVRATH